MSKKARIQTSFSPERPFDATKDADLLDAMNDMLRLAHDCEIPGEITLTLVLNAETFAVQAGGIDGSIFPPGASVREAIQNWLNADV